MVTTFYQTGPNGLFIFYQVFNLILQSANEYFLLAFQQKVGLLNKKAKGTAIKNMFSISHMKNDLIWALPPLSEQSRIITKIRQLFAFL